MAILEPTKNANTLEMMRRVQEQANPPKITLLEQMKAIVAGKEEFPQSS